MNPHRGEIHIGDCVRRDADGAAGSDVTGEYVSLLGEQYYCIRNYDRMAPFFMTVVSSSDLWLFISSSGGLTAGRGNAESALFPYNTDDRITENRDNTGHKAVLLVTAENRVRLWEPFSDRYAGVYRVERNLYKNVCGDKLVFEETNHDLGLTYRYAWRTSDRYGFVKTSWLTSSAEGCSVSLVDGLQNVLPYGITSQTQRLFSNLLDAYKRSELDPQSGLGIFALSSGLTDLAEPSESLRATTVWQLGLEDTTILLSSDQLDTFLRGAPIAGETDVRGGRGAYLVNAAFDLASGEERQWHVVAEVNQDVSGIVSLVNELKGDRAALKERLEDDIDKCTRELLAIVAGADGLQLSADRLSTAHHFANTLFNTMRGGVFADNYNIDGEDLRDFVGKRNRPVLDSGGEFLIALPAEIDVDSLLAGAAATGSVDLERLCYEYLPLTFSRRHGDPSRPWNTFSINVKKPDGTRNLDYQGNWRDIFQNWEALACSYPGFVESMICKFVNATTADGYNPYRVTRDGIEWETPERNDPWANIGYWNDHQIIYLQKLLEISHRFNPGRLHMLLGRRIFSHANVPYRIKPYAALLEDWHDTITFDQTLDRQIEGSVAEMGTDGKLLLDVDGRVLCVSLMEKLLVLLLAKLANLVPGGGIWMNTQRPEWNDANNALAGGGLSVVTACYLRRFVAFCRDLVSAYEPPGIEVTRELKAAFDAVFGILESHAELQQALDDKKRRAVMDQLGQAGSDYRWNQYRNGFSGDLVSLEKDGLLTFLALAQQYIEQTLRANRRPDGLYHAYNILHVGEDGASVGHLYEMLEGQVAILSSGLLSGEESLALLQSLRRSKMYRPDQHSYLLYPDRELPGFLQKNRLTRDQIEKSALLTRLVEDGDRTLVVEDEDGICHFAGTFRNAKDVAGVLDGLRRHEEYAGLVEAESDLILGLFEEVFDHASFTGRSGTFFAYEGLGSIYWHMVSKLLLAVQETFLRARAEGEPDALVQALADAYYDIRSGIGFNKTPDVYGAFPTDPYSHTPAGRGARQPGMTGQVKEELLTRRAELGAFVTQGIIFFDPVLLRDEEYTTAAATFEYVDVEGQDQTIDLPAGSLGYTFCQVPVVCIASEEEGIEVAYADGRIRKKVGSRLDPKASRHIFSRDGRVKQVTVFASRCRSSRG
jgi:hypothetical protein